jgi:Family of unknown function (DUF6433)
MKTSIPQIFEEVEKAGSKESKIKVLRSYETPVLIGVLQVNFNPEVKLSLPEGEPPFKKDTSIPTGYSETNLYTEWRRMYIWLDEKINLTRARKEQLFVQMLEGVHWTEAEVVCMAKDKKLQSKYKSLKEDLVREAFPNILPPKKKAEPVPKKKTASLNAS